MFEVMHGALHHR